MSHEWNLEVNQTTLFMHESHCHHWLVPLPLSDMKVLDDMIKSVRDNGTLSHALVKPIMTITIAVISELVNLPLGIVMGSADLPAVSQSSAVFLVIIVSLSV